MIDTMTRQCAGCGTPLARRGDERTHQYAHRRYCTTVCSDRARTERNRAARRAEADTQQVRVCRHCHTPLVQRDGESNSNYRVRAHCDTRCARLARPARRLGANREPAPSLDVPGLDWRWMDRGRCNGAERELFFADEMRDTSAKKRVAQARAICGGCPVRADCLAYALASHAYGVWGGTTRDQRAALKATVTR